MEELLELLRKAAERTATGQVQRLSLHSSISIKMIQHGRTVLRRFCDEAAENVRHCTLAATWRDNRDACHEGATKSHPSKVQRLGRTYIASNPNGDSTEFNSTTVKPSFHMIITIAAIAEKIAQRLQRSWKYHRNYPLVYPDYITRFKCERESNLDNLHCDKKRHSGV